ncbi:lipoprotein LpqH [Mycobacterium sp.]|uniref:lipoprotein LpqH n=1 Tax=Mycobacterium sp. TaxID=1785 RepID=UPI003F95B07B
MQRRSTAAMVLFLVTAAGCSSAPAALTFPVGALPGGTAQATVNGNGTGQLRGVECQNIGKGVTSIDIGSTGSRITVLVGADTPKAVTFNEVEGFTGSYWQDLQGSARLAMVDQTYTVTGTAAGFHVEQPYTRTTTDFTVKVAC